MFVGGKFEAGAGRLSGWTEVQAVRMITFTTESWTICDDPAARGKLGNGARIPQLMMHVDLSYGARVPQLMMHVYFS
jgi:hypothetical protein